MNQNENCILESSLRRLLHAINYGNVITERNEKIAVSSGIENSLIGIPFGKWNYFLQLPSTSGVLIHFATVMFEVFA